MKKSKVVLLILIFAVACTAIILLLGNNKKNSNTKKEEITIEFDSDGGSNFEKINIKKDEHITLPTPTKEGYNFIGWYLDSKLVNNETTYTSDTKLIAKWEKIPENVKTFTIVFDSKGGNEINGITLECDKEIKLPANPTKKDFIFENWKDDNGNIVSNGDILACKDITLTAVWKENKKDDDNESNSNSNKITYTCPKGYTLKDKKCYNSVDSTEKCPNGTYDYNNSCVRILEKSGIAPIRTCSAKNNIKGIVGLFNDEYYCFYGIVTDANEQVGSDACLEKGHKWDSSSKKCYYDSSSDSSNITYSCNSKNYIYINNPSQFNSSVTDAACFPIFEKIPYCSEGTLEDGKCNIVKDATEKK